VKKISFFAPGIPAPGGSKRAFIVKGRAVLTDAGGAKTKNWRSVVAMAAHTAMNGSPPLTGPVSLRVIFLMPRPKAHFRKDGSLKPKAPEVCSKRPDTTKLLRAVEDAMNGIVWKDDSLVVKQYAEKLYQSLEFPSPGALITIEEIVCDLGNS